VAGPILSTGGLGRELSGSTSGPWTDASFDPSHKADGSSRMKAGRRRPSVRPHRLTELGSDYATKASAVVRALCRFSPVGSTPPRAALSALRLRGSYG
jgi:hypothetical protein